MSNNGSSAFQYFKGIKANNTYLLTDTLPDRQRLTIQVKIYTDAFRQALHQAFSRYNLLPRLQDPSATFRVADLGCGEGLYLPILAEFLAEQGARANLKLIGIDRDSAAIHTAFDYTKALGLTNVELFVHDLTNPLTELEFLNLADPANHFDLLIASVVLMHLSNTVEVLKSFRAVMKPGAAIYTKDMSWETGLEYPSPTFTRLTGLLKDAIIKRMDFDFAPLHRPNLAEAGFVDIESFEDSYPIGGQTQTGKRMLQNIILAQHASRPMFIGMGLLPAEDYDAAIQQEFSEISSQLEGRITLVNTTARQPL